MINPEKIAKIAQYLHKSIPESIHHFTSDLDHKIKKILQNQIRRMNVINRDEFDIHVHILLQTQEKLRQLEKKVQSLESIYQQNIFNKDKNHLNIDDKI